MNELGSLGIFVQVAEAGSFVAASQRLGLSSSAVGKAIARLEEAMGVRLFHRSTRSMALTEEGGYFLESCRRMLTEFETAQAQLSRSQSAPRGQLRLSLPLAGMFLVPTLAGFMEAYPDINLDLDFTDRLVDVIEEGFDAVVRTGEPRDTRLMSRKLGTFKHRIVATPGYLAAHGMPIRPEDLLLHRCLHHRYSNSGKLEPWPFVQDERGHKLEIPVTMVASILEPLVYLAERSYDITCVPPFAVASQLENGQLISILEDHLTEAGSFRVMWPTSRHLSPKVRAFIDYMAAHLFAQQ